MAFPQHNPLKKQKSWKIRHYSSLTYRELSAFVRIKTSSTVHISACFSSHSVNLQSEFVYCLFAMGKSKLVGIPLQC